MKKVRLPIFVLLILCVLFVTRLGAQPVLLNQYCFGSTGSEVADVHCKDNEGNFILAGTNGSLTASEIIIYKVTEDGSTIWNRTYGGTGNDKIHSILATNDGGFVFVGLTSSNDGDVSGNHGDSDIWFVKCDSNGEIEYSKCLGGSGTDEGHSIKQLQNGNYLICGNTSSTDGDLSGLSVLGYDTWLIEADNLGNIIQQNRYGGTLTEWGIKAIEIDENTFAVLSTTMSTNGDVAGSGSHGGEDYWLKTIDRTNWQIVLKKCFGGTSYDDAIDFIQTSDGGFVIAGSSGSSNGNVVGSHGSGEAWIVKTDSELNLLWQRPCGGSLSEKAYTVEESPLGGYVFAGISNSVDGDLSPNNYSYNTYIDIWVFQLDENGNLIWQRKIGSAGGDGTNVAWNSMDMITMNDDGSLYLFSNTAVPNADFAGDITCFEGGADFWLGKIGQPQNTITGKLYYDLNLNSVYDSGDQPAVNKQVVTDQGQTGFSNNNGDYTIFIFEYDTFLVSPQNVDYHSVTPDQTEVEVTNSIPGTYIGYDFAYQQQQAVYDASVVHYPTSGIVKGFPAHFVLEYSNVGTETISSGTVNFTIPFQLASYISASQTPEINGNVLSWSFSDLAPYESVQINFSLLITIFTNSGTPFLSASEIIISDNDSDLSNNLNFDEDVVLAACDPNDIKVSKAEISVQDFETDKLLRYTVRFQNTGTSEAVNIVVKDTIPDYLNISSISLLSSSHPVELLVNNQINEAQFVFNNINLADSASNEAESHGSFVFEIIASENLQLGDSIENKVDIYFDFEAPVRTNTAITKIFEPCNSEFSVLQAGSLLFADSSGFSDFQWYDCNTMEPITGAVLAHYYPLTNGSFKIIASNDDCTFESDCFDIVNQLNTVQTAKILLYPNPASSQLVLNSELLVSEVQIHTITGKLINQIKVNKKQTILNTEDLTDGVYLISVIHENSVFTSKLIINH